MASSIIKRKLAAIMFTDIAGYTALSAKDETKALHLLDTQKQILTPIIKEFNGTLHKEMWYAADNLIWVTPYLYLTYKQLGKDYDVNEIHRLIKDIEDIEFELNLRLYELLEESSYLKTAYNQVQEKVSAIEKELGEKFLSYPIPKQIIEEWEKVSKVKN